MSDKWKARIGITMIIVCIVGILIVGMVAS